VLNFPVTLLSHYLDVVFARSESASLALAVTYALLSFSAMYFSFAGLLAFALRHSPQADRVNPRPIRQGQIRSEIQSSLLSIVMFGLLAGVTFLLLRAGWLRVTGAVSVYRWAAEVVVLFLWNELHFYLSHRLMHSKTFYKKVHLEHHRSVVVTPFSVYRFHWLEALVLGAVMPMAMIFHTFSIWSLLMLPPLSLLWNLVGHSNYRPRARGFGWLARASERHAAHHGRIHGNYGFSLPYLDKWFATALEADILWEPVSGNKKAPTE
jgi:lathosterol oxidase